ncbi:MAG: hypothetical protein R3F44_04255 [Candidatus Competibacteraceae bacterium]
MIAQLIEIHQVYGEFRVSLFQRMASEDRDLADVLVCQQLAQTMPSDQAGRSHQ